LSMRVWDLGSRIPIQLASNDTVASKENELT